LHGSLLPVGRPSSSACGSDPAERERLTGDTGHQGCGASPIWMIDIAALRCHHPMALTFYRKSGGLGSARDSMGV